MPTLIGVNERSLIVHYPHSLVSMGNILSFVGPLCIVGMTPAHAPEMMVATRHMHVLCLSNMKALTITIYMRDERLTPFKSPTTIAFCVIISFHNFGLMIKFHAKG